MVIYLDILFLIQFAAVYLSLWMSGRVMKQNGSFPRRLIGGVVGALSGTVALTASFGAPIQILLTVIGIAASVYLSFPNTRLPKFLRLCGITLLCAAMHAGVVVLLYRIISSMPEAVFPTGKYAEGGLLLILMGISGVVSLLADRLTHFDRRIREIWVRVTYGGHMRKLHLIYDSGNLLTDPISGYAVIAVRATLFPEVPSSVDRVGRCGQIRRMRLIPYNTVGGAGLLVGFMPDSIKLMKKGTYREVEAVIGLMDDEARIPREYDGICPALE